MVKTCPKNPKTYIINQSVCGPLALHPKCSPVCPTFNALLAIGWHERGSPASSDDGSSTAAAVSGRGKLRFGVPHFQTNHDKPVCTHNIPPLIPNFAWAAHGLKILKDHGPYFRMMQPRLTSWRLGLYIFHSPWGHDSTSGALPIA
jgi:hypothetical protein